jgi:hypothetical protein
MGESMSVKLNVELTQDEYDDFTIMCGVGLGWAVKEGTNLIMPRRWLELINKLHAASPDFIPYNPAALPKLEKMKGN